MSCQRDLTWSFQRSPLLPRWEEPRHDVIGDTSEAVTPLPAGGILALVDGAYPALSLRVPGRRSGLQQQLLLLTRERHLLAISRHFVVCQMSLQSFMSSVCERLQQGLLAPSELAASCSRLREATNHRASLLKRLRDDPCLFPTSPSFQEASRDMLQLLLLMAVKATLLTEELVLAVLRRAARNASEITTDIRLSLTIYNQVVSDLAKPAAAMAELRPFCLSRTMEIMAEERGVELAGKFCCTLAESELVDILRSHVQMPGNASNPPSAMGQRSSYSLETLIREDSGHVTPALKVLARLDEKTWKRGQIGSESILYGHYSALLWTVIYSHVFHAFYPGRRGRRALPGLPPYHEAACVSAISLLRDRLASESLPEPGATLGRSLCERLLYTQDTIAWDRAVCRALSSALTDKCSSLDGDDSAPRTHSRTAGILVTVCQPLSRSLSSVTWAHPPSCSVFDPASWQQGLLSRCALSLQLCGAWLRGRMQVYSSSGSLAPLVLITHGDLPVVKVECRLLVAAVENAAWLPLTQRLCVKLQSSWDVLEGLLLSLPPALGSVCSRKAREIFQHMMPAGRYWRGKTGTGVEPAVSEYAEAGLDAVLRPVLQGVRPLCEEERAAALSAALSIFMKAWMDHILLEKPTFSLQGALQLRRDFESVRDLLRSQEAGLSPEVVQAVLSLPVFIQADNAIVCLLQQPSRKAYLQSGSCSLFLCCPPVCRVAVESVSDSLQSLESLERRAWERGVSGRLPRHSHDSYLPHNQRQWLSLRLHKRWSGLSLPWEGRESSDG